MASLSVTDPNEYFSNILFNMEHTICIHFLKTLTESRMISSHLLTCYSSLDAENLIWTQKFSIGSLNLLNLVLQSTLEAYGKLNLNHHRKLTLSQSI